MSRKINAAGLNLIKSFEGLKLTAYLDIVGVPTIGYGTTSGVSKADVDSKRTITEAEAESLLMKDVAKFEAGVERLVTSQINENQFSALVCFAYNVGLGSLEKSTLLRLLNAGDISAAGDQFLRWNKAGGKEVTGLTRRRQAERSLFLQSPPAKQEMLPDGPSNEEIAKILSDIEDDLKV